MIMLKITQNRNYAPEPEELQELKKLLAENTCRCKLCAGHKKSIMIQYQDKEIQVKSLNTLQQLSHETQIEQGSYKDIFCPGCRMAMNLLHRNDLKILKDEESQTYPQKFDCIKSTEKVVVCVEKSTSDTNKSTSVNVSTTLIQNQKKITGEASRTKCQEVKAELRTRCNHSHCMSNFINSIRPPLSNGDIINT